MCKRVVALQRGQVLVIFAGGLILLLAIAALVIDIGFVWMIRRQEQNAADPGAVAAARYIQPSADTGRMREAACFYARQNGFFGGATANNECTPDRDANAASLAVNYPPSASAGDYSGRPGYVEVVITRPHQSFFAGIVGLTTFTVSTAAVAAFDEGDAGSSSLIALNPTACSSGQVAGTGSVDIFPADGVLEPGGYVQVNSICGGTADANTLCGNEDQGGLKINGTSELTAPDVFVRGLSTCKGGGDLVPPTDLTEGAAFVGDPLGGLRPPPFPPSGSACAPGNNQTTEAGSEGCSLKDSVSLSPGTYYGGWQISTPGAAITLSEGIYVIAGGGIRDTGGLLTSAGGRVLIFSTDNPRYAEACRAGTDTDPKHCQGELRLNGASSLSLTGLDDSPCPPVSDTGCPFAGMLIWQDGRGSNPSAPVQLNGGSNLYLSGTIYAPGAEVSVSGNGVETGCTPDTDGNINCAAVQIVADKFSVGGTGYLEMPYDPNKLYHLNLKGLVR